LSRNTACDHVPHLMHASFTGEAYIQARARLPLELFQRLLHVPPSPPFPKLKGARGLPRSAWIKWLGHCDQQVEWFKPMRPRKSVSPHLHISARQL
jgi:hypothetical protein